jgi:ParB-like chromosome segregation protein Spo0J
MEEEIIEVETERLKTNPSYYLMFPRPSIETYEALKQDIALQGQTTPIEVNEDFEVLDGYSRLSVLKDLRIPKAKVIVKKFNNKTEEFWYVYSKNAIRRDLNTWQKIVATLKTIEEVLKCQGVQISLKDCLQKRGRKSAPSAEFRTEGIAKKLGLGVRTVEMALYVYFHGTQELHQQLDKGEISIKEAYLKLKQQGQKQQPIQPQKKQTSDKISIYKHAIITCPHCGKPFALGEVI